MFQILILIPVTYVEFIHPEWLILLNINYAIVKVIFLTLHGTEFSHVAIQSNINYSSIKCVCSKSPCSTNAVDSRIWHIVGREGRRSDESRESRKFVVMGPGRWPSAKHLSHKHTDLSLIPRTHEKPGIRVTFVIPEQRRQSHADPWGLLPSQPRLPGEFQIERFFSPFLSLLPPPSPTTYTK